RQQAVDCFRSLGISTIIAESFGSIYERNAINSAMPIMIAENLLSKVKDGDILRVNFQTGKIKNVTKNEILKAQPFSEVQMDIYQRGGLLKEET
ncbi:homoaconitate hydratase, partial [candidate division WOR-3 bacterium]|nr:homoaconitate hydratase [candidate division WOR-3 bacterium]